MAIIWDLDFVPRIITTQNQTRAGWTAEGRQRHNERMESVFAEEAEVSTE